MPGKRDDVPSAAEHGKLRAALARLGATPGEVGDAVGIAPGGKKRAEIALLLIAWARGLPKKAG